MELLVLRPVDGSQVAVAAVQVAHRELLVLAAWVAVAEVVVLVPLTAQLAQVLLVLFILAAAAAGQAAQLHGEVWEEQVVQVSLLSVIHMYRLLRFQTY
jgi:hypothetical protein